MRDFIAIVGWGLVIIGAIVGVAAIVPVLPGNPIDGDVFVVALLGAFVGMSIISGGLWLVGKSKRRS